MHEGQTLITGLMVQACSTSIDVPTLQIHSNVNFVVVVFGVLLTFVFLVDAVIAAFAIRDARTSLDENHTSVETT